MDRKLTETPHRETYIDDSQMQLASAKEKYRLTARGVYHLRRWVPTFAYLDAMALDTPMFDDRVRETLLVDLESFDIRVRFSRATAFRSYLLGQWQAAEVRASYFDFETLLRRAEPTFQAVQQHTLRHT